MKNDCIFQNKNNLVRRMNFFPLLPNFNVWLNRRQLRLLTCCNMLFGWNIWRKSDFTHICNWKNKSILIHFSNNWEFYSLILHPNSKMLFAEWNLKQYIGLSWIFNGYFINACFYNIMRCSFGKYRFLNSWRSSKCCYIWLHNMKK